MSEKEKLIGLFVGKLMGRGGRVRAEKILLECISELRLLQKKENKLTVDPLEIILVALDKISPLVEMKSRKVGGTVYRIPVDISAERGATLGIKMLLESVEGTLGASLSNRLVRAILAAYVGEGKAVDRVREIHDFAKKNRGLVKFL